MQCLRIDSREMEFSRSSCASDCSAIGHANCIREVTVPLSSTTTNELASNGRKSESSPPTVQPITTADGNVVIMHTPPGQLIAYDVVAKCEVRRSSEHDGAMLCLAMMSDNRHFISGGEDKEVGFIICLLRTPIIVTLRLRELHENNITICINVLNEDILYVEIMWA